MPEFELIVGEVLEGLESPLQPDEPTPEVRSVVCKVRASTAEQAKEMWQPVWEAKYGKGRLPVSMLIDIRELR